MLATVRPDRRPHAVPIVFALDGDWLYTAIDAKPKSTAQLARLVNIASQPEVSVLAQHYEEDWKKLWWVRADGTARIVEDPERRMAAIRLLTAKYQRYQDQAPSGDVIAVRIKKITGWAWSEAGI